MQLTAKLVQLLPVQTGTGKNGQWKKQDMIVETEATYPKKICVSVWGDKIDTASFQPGNLLKIDFDWRVANSMADGIRMLKPGKLKWRPVLRPRPRKNFRECGSGKYEQ